MKNRLIYALLLVGVVAGMTSSCIKDPYDAEAAEALRQQQIAENVASVFGVTFSSNQNWSTTKTGSVTITANADMEDIAKVAILACSIDEEGLVSDAKILNEAAVEKGQQVTLNYDLPSYCTRLYAACVSSDNALYIKGFDFGQESVNFEKAQTRALDAGISAKFDVLKQLPAPVLTSEVESFAHQRGYEGFENDRLLGVSNDEEISRMVSLSEFDYADDERTALRDIIFTYLPNKKSNIEKIRESQYYNASSYPLTTGNDYIVVEPVYRGDGNWKEVEGCELYYYYFQDSDVENMSDAEQIQFYKSLPKYRAANIKNSVSSDAPASIGMPNDLLRKNTAYALIYWGDGTPEVGVTTGQYRFPEGYRIGFMLRNNDSNKNHHGELYCDGRLNKEVNKYGHLASSKLGDTDARMAWMFANNKFFLCCESGTDRDFNDLILEIEGAVDPLVPMIQPDYNTYTFCFEDRDLGDYDMNDVVIKAQRIDQKHVKYSLEATGAMDELYLRNINGTMLNSTTEIHALFGLQDIMFVNVQNDAIKLAPVQEIVEVSPQFSFSDLSTQLFIYNKTTNREIKIAQKGEDPHAIMIPYDFQYPEEQVCIKDAYLQFNNWGQNEVSATDWYLYPVDGNVYTKSIFK